MKNRLILIVFLSNIVLNAQYEPITGPIPTLFNIPYNKTEVQAQINLDYIAYGFSTLDYLTISMPIPEGYPLTFYNSWPGYATSMCLGGDGLYYLTTLNGYVYRFHSQTHSIDLNRIYQISGLITGDKVNGISYNPVNNKYYIAAGSDLTQSDNIYQLNITNGQANLIGPTNTGGLLADLTITCDGICYAYAFITKNSYKIDLSTGNATLLGPLGYNPYYGQGMDVDRRSGIVYISAFDSTTFTGQLRILDTQKGETTLVSNWGSTQICAFAISNKCDYYDDCMFNAPTNPLPASGTFGLPITLDSLRWSNDPGTTNIKVYFGEIWDLHLIYNGPVISSLAVPELHNDLVYTWRVIAENNNCEKYSHSWIFGTIDSTSVNTLFIDDFENGIGGWLIENVNGNCNWELFNYPYPNSYTLPLMPSGNVLSADADFCGTETTINSTALINQVFDLTSYQWAWIEFDYDWRIFRNNDKAIVEISTNGGVTWTELWNQTGNRIRNCHEIVDITKIGAGKNNVMLRFASNQPGWDWWWVIDNIEIKGIDCGYCVPIRPTNLSLYNWGYKKIRLNWHDNSSTEYGFNIERKLGDSLSIYQFENVGITESNITTFLDTTVNSSTMYTYRVNAFNENGNSESTNWKTITSTIPVELISFSATADKNQVKIVWRTASELNNHIFEIQRSRKDDEFYTIGFIEGHGTTTEINDYNYVDKNVERGKYYYRLNQIDFNGVSELSEEIEVDVLGIMKFDVFQNFPNPFNPSTIIKYQIPSKINVTLKIYDVLGNEIATLVNEEKQPGTYEVKFDGTGFPSGIYLYKLIAGNYIETKKMVLVK
jgi:hypothetical protein